MKISFDLSPEGIQKAIDRLNDVKENLEIGMNDLVEVLAQDGALEANKAYGRMASAAYVPESMTSAKIVATGDQAIIAEFGAGYATMENHPFAAKAPVPIEPTSYSRAQFPYGLFYITDDLMPGEGYWFFGGKEYDRVEPRHGLLNAYEYILQNSTRIAKEVIKL